jgi:hypothetical protein
VDVLRGAKTLQFLRRTQLKFPTRQVISRLSQWMTSAHRRRDYYTPIPSFVSSRKKQKRIRNGYQTRMEKTSCKDRPFGFGAACIVRRAQLSAVVFRINGLKRDPALAKLAGDAPDDFESPAPLREDFEEGLSAAFWDFTIINGAGQVSHEAAWHAAEMVIDHQLILRHVQDS